MLLWLILLALVLLLLLSLLLLPLMLLLSPFSSAVRMLPKTSGGPIMPCIQFYVVC